MKKKQERHDGRVVLYGKDALQEYLRQAEPIYKTVSSTMGAGGRNVLIKKGWNDTIITKDGLRCALNVSTEMDTDVAAEMLKKASYEANKVSGDGSTAVIVYGYHLLRLGAKAVSGNFFTKGSNPIKLKQGIDIGLQEILKHLTDMSKEGNVHDIAMVSSNNDKEISDLVVKAYDIVGKNGMINIVQSNNRETEIETSEGIVIDKGWTSLVFSDGGKPVKYGKSFVMVVDDVMDRTEKIHYYLEYAMNFAEENAIPLIVIANKFGNNVLNFFGHNRRESQLPVVLVNAPLFSEERTTILQDICNITGAKLIGDKFGNILEMGITGSDEESRIRSCGNMLGIVEGVVVSAEKTMITPIKSDWEKYLSELGQDIDEQRLAVISGKICTIKLGGNSDTEISERADRLEDTRNSVKNALREGVVPGAGFACYEIKKQFKHLKEGHRDVIKGHKLVYDILDSAANKIVENAGFSSKIVEESYENGCLFNVNTEKHEHISDTNIIDPVFSIKKSLEKAVSTIGTLLTSGAYVKSN